MSKVLTPRYYPLRPHAQQLALRSTKARFPVVPAGRRSGKTEQAKRKLVRTALGETEWPDARFFAGAPTRDQAKRIYWDDLKKMVPKWCLADRPSESELTIRLINGASISVVGMDKPERIEGSPWNGGILDEFANMKKGAWGENVRPALSDRRGWCWLIGVPEGRNHYYDLYERALADTTGEWAVFQWPSSDILPPEEIAAARRELDELTFQQEYEASFLNFTGRVYYAFERSHNCSTAIEYDPKLDLAFCFDFNVSPGVCCVTQESPKLPSGCPGTAVIGEVYIPSNSNTPAVCRRLIKDWEHHRGRVYLYGDATGGSSGSAKVMGSDWELIRATLKPVFGDRLYNSVPASNPSERMRVNSVNSRCRTAEGAVRLMINPAKAPRTVKDLEGVRVLEGGAGEIDKKSDPDLSHISDALGYEIAYKFPINEAGKARVRDF